MDRKKEILLFLFGISLLVVIVALILIFQNQRNLVSADSNTTASFSLSPSSSQVYLGEYKKIEIIADGNIVSKEASVKLKYDPQVLEVIDQNYNEEGVQVDTGNLYENYYENNVDVDSGTIAISAASKFPVVINSPRIFATFYIKIIKQFPATNINFAFEKGKTSETNLFCLAVSEDDQERDCLQGVLNSYFEMQ